MKVSFDTDAVVRKGVELTTKGYDKAKELAPSVKEKAGSLFDRIKEAAKEGKEAARR